PHVEIHHSEGSVAVVVRDACREVEEVAVVAEPLVFHLRNAGKLLKVLRRQNGVDWEESAARGQHKEGVMGKTPDVVCRVARQVTIQGDLTYSSPVSLDDLDVADVEELLRFLKPPGARASLFKVG